MKKKTVTAAPEQNAKAAKAITTEKKNAEILPAAAEKTAAKSVKPAAKRKSAPAKSASAVSQKKAARKPKPITIEDLSAKLAGKINKTAADKLTGTIAVDIEVWGWDDDLNRHMYIEIINGRVTVAPYNYEDRNLEAYISFADAKDIVDGKLSVKDAFKTGKLNASGDVRSALTFASLF